MYKNLIILTLLSLSINSINCALNATELLPCTLQPIAEVHCYGDQITDQVFKNVALKLGASELQTLVINNTELTALHRQIFVDVVIEKIIIENNAKLVTIDANAFKTSPAVKSVTIRNNPNLVDSNNTFSAVRNLNPSQGIILIGNGFREIPERGLASVGAVESRLQYIYIGNNQIRSIGANAFLGHSNLAYLELDNNEIDQLSDAALNLTQTLSGPHPGLVYVLLANNNLTEKSFTSAVFGTQKNAIALDLEFNHFTDFPQLTFTSFLSHKGSVVYLYENPIICNCSLKWTFQLIIDNFIEGLYCTNLKKPLEGLTEKDIGCTK
jgi:hypothetical protein